MLESLPVIVPRPIFTHWLGLYLHLQVTDCLEDVTHEFGAFGVALHAHSFEDLEAFLEHVGLDVALGQPHIIVKQPFIESCCIQLCGLFVLAVDVVDLRHDVLESDLKLLMIVARNHLTLEELGLLLQALQPLLAQNPRLLVLFGQEEVLGQVEHHQRVIGAQPVSYLEVMEVALVIVILVADDGKTHEGISALRVEFDDPVETEFGQLVLLEFIEAVPHSKAGFGGEVFIGNEGLLVVLEGFGIALLDEVDLRESQQRNSG